MSSVIKLLVVEDRPIVLRGLVALLNLEPGFEVVGQTADADEAIQIATDLIPDVVLLDYKLPNKSGAQVARLILEQNPSISIVMLSLYTSPMYVYDSIDAGVRGYVTKGSNHEVLVDAIWQVHQGGRYLDYQVCEGLEMDAQSAWEKSRRALYLLNADETRVLKLMAEGYHRREIANMMGILESRFDAHRNQIKDKTGLQTNAALIGFAIENGLVEPMNWAYQKAR